MRSTLLFLIAAIILSSCASTNKMLVQGNYDAVIDRSVKKLIKDPQSAEDADLLDKAYNLANERDQSRVKYLKQEGNPNSWDETFSLLNALKNRQEYVRKVLPLNIKGRTIDYPRVDYDAEIIEAKRKASDYFYANGKRLMAQNTKDSYRQAYAELSRARDYSGGSYLDADQLISECRYKGISRVIVQVENKTILRLPDNWVKDVLTFNTDGLNSQWVEYNFASLDNTTQYDYVIDVILKDIAISPDQKNDKDYMVKKDVPDGFNYLLDAKGNVQKDTAGNDIKIPKYKTLACTLIETQQLKQASVKGEVQFILLNPDKLLKTEPIASETRFEYKSARAVGDVAALSPEQQQMTQVKEVPFPTDMEMIARTTENIRLAVRDAIYRNRSLIR